MAQELASNEKIWPVREVYLHAPEEFTHAYDRYAPEIYRHTLSRMGDKGAAEDITSQVFLKAWDYAQQVREPIENVRAFLFRITHNLITDTYRKRKMETVPIDMVPEYRLQTTSPRSIEERLVEREVVAEVEQALLRLNEDYRAMLVWRYVDELSVEEIVVVSGKSAGAVYVTIHRALKEIRVVLRGQGVSI